MNPIKDHLHDQFHRPRGPLGRLAGRIMSRRTSNLDRTRWTVDLLELAPDARILEVGHGPGIGLEASLAAAPRGRVVGLDHSRTMHAMAAKRNRAALGAGRLQLLVDDAEHPPPGLGRFDAIYSCNVWLFWTDPVPTIAALSDLLVPGGRMAITHLPRHGNATPMDTEAAAVQIRAQMADAGLAGITTHALGLEPVPATCVIGRCSSSASPRWH